jgi:hypothetical protein
MLLYKFITYFKDGVLTAKLSKPFKQLPNGSINENHAKLCAELQNEGVVSDEILSVGCCVVSEENNPIIIENTFAKQIDIEQLITSAIKANLIESIAQELFEFAKER